MRRNKTGQKAAPSWGRRWDLFRLVPAENVGDPCDADTGAEESEDSNAQQFAASAQSL